MDQAAPNNDVAARARALLQIHGIDPETDLAALEGVEAILRAFKGDKPVLDPPIPPRPSVEGIGPEGYNEDWDDIKWFPVLFSDEQAPMHVDRAGEPLSLRQWCACVEDADYRWVARTRVGRSEIVTVWQGMCGFDYPQSFGTIERRWFTNPGEATYHDEESDWTELSARLTHARRVKELEHEETIDSSGGSGDTTAGGV